MKDSKTWFGKWFDSPFYHLLYSNRDDKEAENFIQNLAEELAFKEGESALDLACGKGRHSRTLHRLGLKVTGLDLSPASIITAKQFSEDGLDFVQGDMRTFDLGLQFDYIFNFFTSFGYFDNWEENLEVLKRIHSHLNDSGRLMIDFLNRHKVASQMIEEEVVIRENVEFHIHRSIDQGFILKDISFNHLGDDYSYTEKVQDLDLEDFRKLLSSSNIEIVDTYGNYDLQPFDPVNSDRLIIIAKKA
jgi:SAM-dependent methyltransferase